MVNLPNPFPPEEGNVLRHNQKGPRKEEPRNLPLKEKGKGNKGENFGESLFW